MVENFHARTGCLGLSLAVVITATAAGQPAIQFLAPPAGFFQSFASAISDDGLVVAGRIDMTGANRAARWTSTTGWQNLGVLPGFENSFAEGISADGSVVVGFCSMSGGGLGRAFRWSETGGMQDLGTLPGHTHSTAWAVSADGSRVVGESSVLSWTVSQAFLWTDATGMQGLGTLPGGSRSSAWAISADGTIVMGSSATSTKDLAFRWTKQTGMQSLGTALGFKSSVLRATSGDGDWAAGEVSGSESTPNTAIARWSVKGGMESIGALPTCLFYSLFGLAINGNGQVIGGSCMVSQAGPPRAIYWSSNQGLVFLDDYLSSLGLPMAGVSPFQIAALTPDATTAVGSSGKGAYMVTGLPAFLPACKPDCDGSGELTIDDFICFSTLFAIANPLADCDESGSLEIDDFICFQTHFAIGC